MRTITLELPDEDAATAQDTRMRVAVALYNAGALTMGQCAEIAGIAKRDFILASAPYGGLALGPQTVEEWQQEVASIKRIEGASRHQ